MSLRSWFSGVGFRSATPKFNPGDTVEVILTGYDRERDLVLARIGDTLLTVDGVGPGDVGDQHPVRITSFDEEQFTGEAVAQSG